MGLPTLVKTWQFAVNQTVAAQGSGVATDQAILYAVKNILSGFGTLPWTVRGSSNSSAAAMDATDRWTSAAAVVKAGGAHSWIVLRQTGIATNFELCLDCNSGAGGSITVVISPSAGFTGGSTTARPTATDEIVLINSTTWCSGQDVQHQIHAMQSTDGQCTRLQIWRGGTNQCTFWLFDKPNNPPAGWTNPSVSIALGTSSGIVSSYSNLQGSSNFRGRGSATFNMFATGENAQAVGNSIVAADASLGLGSVPNDFDAAWPFYPIGIGSSQASHRGRHGSLFDLWWRPNAVNDADTFPNNAATRQFVAMANLIHPWVGDSTVPLLT